MSLHIVIIDDNPGDAMLLRHALFAECDCECVVISHGDRAYEFLQQCAEGIRDRPHLIVLDLNLPGKTGPELLGLVRSMPGLQDIPVAVVSSSPQDIVRREAAAADCYITKPSDLDAFMLVGKELFECLRRRRGSDAVPKTMAAGSRSDWWRE